MKVTLLFVPNGGGETDYEMSLETNSVPQKGDYISIKNEDGNSDFIVNRSWFFIENKNDGTGVVENIYVECYFAESSFSSESHKISCNMYKHRGKGHISFDDTCY